jgi:1-acyl-sn-glycerol-3-phosphate acyltransferase
VPDGSALRGVLRGLALLGLNLLLVPPYLTIGTLSRHAGRELIRLYCRATCLVLGIEVRWSGAPFRACPTLFVANHVSYLDVVILGGLLDATFIAKLEVAGWPLFGQLARLTGTFFVRRRWRDALIQRNALAARMREGESFILFAEGTSTDGLSVRPFKTSLLSVAEPWVLDRPVATQPVTLAFQRLRDGGPIGPDRCRRYAWYGDARFLPHLWGVLCRAGLEVAVALGPPSLSWAVTSRKRLGVELRGQVAARLADLRGAAGEPLPDLSAPAAQGA